MLAFQQVIVCDGWCGFINTISIRIIFETTGITNGCYLTDKSSLVIFITLDNSATTVPFGNTATVIIIIITVNNSARPSDRPCISHHEKCKA